MARLGCAARRGRSASVSTRQIASGAVPCVEDQIVACENEAAQALFEPVDGLPDPERRRCDLFCLNLPVGSDAQIGEREQDEGERHTQQHGKHADRAQNSRNHRRCRNRVGSGPELPLHLARLRRRF